MSISTRTLVNDVIGYSFGVAVNRVLGIVVAGIYPILLSREEYGRLDVVFSVTTLLSILFFLGLDVALGRFYYEYDDDKHRRQLVSAVFWIVMGFTLAAVALLLVASKPLALWLYGDSRYILYLRLALLAMPFAMANGVQMVVLRLRRRVHAFNLIMIGNLMVASAIGITSILLLKIGAAGMLAGFIAGNLATSIAGVILNRREISAWPAMGKMRELLAVGLPLVLSGTALWLIGFVNRPILVRRVSAQEVGLYALASGAVGMMSLLMGGFRNAWQPFAFSIMGYKGAEKVYGRMLTWFTVAAGSVVCCGSLFAPEMLLIINAYTHKNWSEAAPAIGPLALGALFHAMYFVVQTGVHIARRTSLIALTMVIGAITSLALNFALIAPFGILGAALANAAGHLAALIGLYALAQRVLPIPYQRNKLIAVVFITGIVVTLAQLINTGSLLNDVLLKLVLLILYAGALLACRVLTISHLISLIRTSRQQTHAESEEIAN